MTDRTSPLDRRAAVRVSPQQILQMLDMPEDVRVLAIDASNDPVGFTVIVTKPDLPVVPQDTVAPYLHSHTEVFANGERKVTYLWPSTCPECANGKHVNCDGASWSDAAGCHVPCACTHEDAA